MPTAPASDNTGYLAGPLGPAPELGSLEVVARLSEILPARAELARRLAAALEAGQTESVCRLSDSLEVLRPELSTLNTRLREMAPRAPAGSLSKLRASIAEVAFADNAVSEQLAAAGAPSLEAWLLTRGMASQAVLERVLSPPWDLEVDLVVVAGERTSAIQRQLLERGQKRIITLDPGRPQTLVPEGTDPPAVSNFHTMETLDAAVSLIPWPHPAQARTIAVGQQPPVPMDDLVARIKRTLRTLTEASNELEEAVPFFAQTAVRNLANIANHPSVSALRGALAGVPAVVVSAGPSLDKNIAQLRGLEGRVVIIGINQTVRALRQAGVRADMVIVVDPMKVGYHFEGMAPDEIGTLFLGASVDPSLFSLPTRNIVTFAASPLAESWIFELAGEDASSGSGGTVATAALKLAAWLGCTPIISIGRDLALDGKRYYAATTADGGHEVELTDGGQKISFASYGSKLRLAEGGDDTSVRQLLASQVYELHNVPGFYGAPVTTTNLFMYEMDLLRETLHKLSGDAQFINATEGGAFLEGMEHLTLAEALARCPQRPVDVDAVVRGRLSGLDHSARRRKLVAGLKTLLRDLDATVALARRAAEPVGGSDPLSLSRRERLLERTRQQLARASRSRLLMSMLVQRATRTIGRKQPGKWSSLKEVDDAELALYRAIEQTIGELARGIENKLPEIVEGER